MNRTSFVRAVLTIAILAGTSTIRADEPAKTDPKDVEISALRAKVTAQSDEIQKLRAELKELRAKQQMKVLVVPQPPNAPQVVPAPGSPRIQRHNLLPDPPRRGWQPAQVYRRAADATAECGGRRGAAAVCAKAISAPASRHRRDYNFALAARRLAASPVVRPLA
jgi:hypothetical protein